MRQIDAWPEDVLMLAGAKTQASKQTVQNDLAKDADHG
jgi:hypothetical protein